MPISSHELSHAARKFEQLETPLRNEEVIHSRQRLQPLTNQNLSSENLKLDVLYVLGTRESDARTYTWPTYSLKLIKDLLSS